MIALDELQKSRATEWFESLRDRLVAAFEAIEDEGAGEDEGSGARTAGRFEFKPWDREGGGGGTMALMRGHVLEKAGVNVSAVEGEFDRRVARQNSGRGRRSAILGVGHIGGGASALAAGAGRAHEHAADRHRRKAGSAAAPT